MSKQIVKQLLPEELTTLRRILKEKHRDILESLTPDAPLEQSLAEIARELGIVVDGMYEIGDFCTMLLRALENKERRAAGLVELRPHLGMQMMQTALELEVKQKSKAEIAEKNTFEQGSILLDATGPGPDSVTH